MKDKILNIALILILIFNVYTLSTQANICSSNIKNNENINSILNVELAKVKRVVDGDTLNLYTGSEIIKTRLFAIDCMETSKNHRAYRQAYDNNLSIEEVINRGEKATMALKRIISENNNYVYFRTLGVDKYNRLIAILYNRNFENINDMLVKTGYCLIYKYKK